MELNDFLEKDNHKDYYLNDLEHICYLIDDDYIDNKYELEDADNNINYFYKNKDKIKVKLFNKDDIKRIINLLDKYEHVSYANQYYDLEDLRGLDKLKFNNWTDFESEDCGWLWNQHEFDKINGVLKKNVRTNLYDYLEEVVKGNLVYLIEINGNHSSSFILSYLDENTIYREDFSVYLT